MTTQAFTPVGATVSAAVTGSSAATALTAFAGLGGGTVRVNNIGTQTIFIAFGASTVTAATATGMPMIAGATEVFTVGPGVTHIAAIAATTGSTVYVTSGQGL